MNNHNCALAGLTGVLATAGLFLACNAWAQQKAFDIPAADAVDAIPEFARQAGIQVVAPADHLRGIKTPAIKGDLDAREALKQLLIGTGLEIASDDGTVVALRKAGSSTRSSARGDAFGESLDEVIVTGSRIKRVDAEGPSPVLALTRERIERSGAATLTEFMRTALPIQTNSITDSMSYSGTAGQSNVNLRGLGNGATLTLINGRRYALSGNSRSIGGDITNINSIPLGAIERVEVLKDGASAIYGSDAIAGVVNIILRKDYEGTEANLYYNNTFDTDSTVVNGSITTGLASPRGSAVLTIEAYKQSGMMATDRDFSASADQRRRGGLDVRFGPGVRGTVYAMPGQVLPGVFLPNGRPATFAAIPANQSGTGLTPASFAATAGVRDILDQNTFVSIVPERKTFNFMGSFEYEVGGSTRIFGQAAYSRTDTASSVYNVQVERGELVIPANNPHNPFGVPVMVEKNLATEFGGGVRGDDYDDYGIVAGLRGKLGGTWEWEAAFTHGQSNTTTDFNLYSMPRGAANAALTDPALAYNWFTDPAAGVANSAAQIAALQGFENAPGVGKLNMVDANVRGELFTLFGNSVRAVLGAEQRRDHYQQSYYSNQTDPATETFTGVIQSQSRKITSVFAEMSVPFVGSQQNVPLVYSLELSLAGRYEDLDEFGTTTDPRVGIRWQPVRSLLVRASFGTSFRAPAANQVGSMPLLSVRDAIDPLRGNESYSFTTYEESDMGLGPETSDNFSAGIVFEPERLRGLVIGLDWYRIEYQDKFAYLLPDRALRYESTFGRFITREAPSAEDAARGWAGRVTSMNLGFVNLAQTEVSGIDFELRYGWDTAVGRFNYSLLGTRTLEFEEAVAPGVPTVDRLGEYTYPKQWQGNTSLFWERGGLQTGVTFRYVHSYSIAGSGVFNPPRKIDALQEFDVQASYVLPRSMRVTLGVNNVFDEDPPFFYAPRFFIGNLGFDRAVSSPRGATYYMSVRKEF